MLVTTILYGPVHTPQPEPDPDYLISRVAEAPTPVVVPAAESDTTQPVQSTDDPVPATQTGMESESETTVSSTTSVPEPWYSLAVCESGYGGPPQWDLNTGNGFYGGLQFVQSTWEWMGGTGYPHHASAAEQVAVAERLRAHEVREGRGGYNPWPACADKLGLPR